MGFLSVDGSTYFLKLVEVYTKPEALIIAHLEKNKVGTEQFDPVSGQNTTFLVILT